ncbi:TPA: NAD-dependent DNA ligase LigA [Clostridium botulinum]|nr:NAD-dependent DNA ligase LigA [Clostridium botulinum]HBJ1652757.1 NAD-dependent DNA ligase LigA [Clostridium botulinum]
MEEMLQLINQLNQYSYEYYTLGQPTISDQTYDSLYDNLVKLEKESEIIMSNSPTQKVGNTILDKLQKSKHKYPMLSLNKTKSVVELYKFTNIKDCILMHKLDGLTIALTYDKNGNLIKGETRGNGEVGEDITHNVKVFSNVPLKINFKGENEIVIIGEAIIDYYTFNKINSNLSEDKQYKNPRNLCSGTVRQLNSEICKQRNIRFIGYIIEGLDLNIKEEQLVTIDNFGFETVKFCVIDKNIPTYSLEHSINYLKQLAKDKQIPIDGLVLQFNDIKYGKSLGNTSHHPQHSLAFKFENDVEFTNLIDVEWNVSRTGRVNPIAIFEPVELYGTTVSRASLNNLTILKSLQLGVGDELGVTKANEIIPMITDNLTKSNTLKIPTKCPVCKSQLIIKSDTDSEFLYCENPSCNAKLIQSIAHYCSRNAINIEGLSEKTIEKFVNLGYLKNVLDIYYLFNHRFDILQLEGFGVKSYNNLLKSIEKSRQCKLENFIYALGIPNVGLSTTKNIVEFADGDSITGTLSNIENFYKNKWLKMKDSGEVLSSNIINWFNNQDNFNLYYNLIQELEFIEEVPQKIKEGILNGKALYLTGTFAFGKKKELKELVELNGGIFSDKFNKFCDYLVIGSVKGSTKDKKAKDMGLEVLYENEFLNMLGVNN